MHKLSVTLITLLLLLGSCQSDASSQQNVLYPNEIINGSFEQGMTGWTVAGLGGFSEDDLSTLDTLPDDKPSLKVGTTFYGGATASLPSFVGTLTSDPFTLKGIGVISFKIGAAKNQEKSYIEFFKLGSEIPLQFFINRLESKVSRFTNADFNGTTITSQLIRNVADLSEHLHETIYIKVTDADTSSDYSDYSFWNLDDFKIVQTAQEKNDALVEREDQLIEFAEEDIDQNPPVESLRNGGFELGNTDYWKVMSGKAFSGTILKNATDNYWGNRLYHAEGNYLIDTFLDETLTGRLRSEKFIVTDQGNQKSYVSFKMGGAAQSSIYVSMNDGTTNEELIVQRNEGFRDPGLALSLVTYYVDVSNYIGSTLYFSLVDSATSGPFGALVADDFRINLSEEQVINQVNDLRQWADNLSDAPAKIDYVAVYNGGISFPLSGVAPTIELSNGFAYETTVKVMTTSLNNYLQYIRTRDDYTKTTGLTRSITKVTYNGVEVNEPNLVAFTFQEGIYLLDISVKDAFNNETTAQIKLTVLEEVSYDHQIENGDFETGTLAGWTVIEGNVNVTAAISNQTMYWAEEIPFNKQGEYFFNGWDANSIETTGYTLQSSKFTLGGSGQISFKLGGRSSMLKVYHESGSLLATYRNYNFNDDGALFPLVKNGSMLATMTTYVADLNQYMNDNLYIEIIDEVISQNWAVAFFDDIKTYYNVSIDINEFSDTVSQNGEEVHLPYLAAQAN